MQETERLEKYWDRILSQLHDQKEEEWLYKKVSSIESRGDRIQRVSVRLKPYHRSAYEDKTELAYMLHLALLLKNGRQSYLEEGLYHGKATFLRGEWTGHAICTEDRIASGETSLSQFVEKGNEETSRFAYNRREAVRYAERWWNSYNPAYRHFDVDCTNYISQCLKAGGAPMWGMPNRGKGWWYSGNSWSYSWAVAHALRWYLSGARKGLTATEVSSADQLSPGDVICYDFQGNDRFDHNTMVVKKNSDGMPLVNAHTSNSRHRYWAYEDSTAYTPNIQYKFFRIGG
ncbi:hypothetical protein EQV77_11835 [Halobacillus fulvus]|nr:hypothetical protein EQV77_11835 [Halobacillus fulvus]